MRLFCSPASYFRDRDQNDEKLLSRRGWREDAFRFLGVDIVAFVIKEEKDE